MPDDIQGGEWFFILHNVDVIVARCWTVVLWDGACVP